MFRTFVRKYTVSNRGTQVLKAFILILLFSISDLARAGSTSPSGLDISQDEIYRRLEQVEQLGPTTDKKIEIQVADPAAQLAPGGTAGKEESKPQRAPASPDKPVDLGADKENKI